MDWFSWEKWKASELNGLKIIHEEKRLVDRLVGKMSWLKKRKGEFHTVIDFKIYEQLYCKIGGLEWIIQIESSDHHLLTISSRRMTFHQVIFFFFFCELSSICKYENRDLVIVWAFCKHLIRKRIFSLLYQSF